MDPQAVIVEYGVAITRLKAAEISWGPEGPVPDGPPGVESVSRIGVAPDGARITVVCIREGQRVGYDGAVFERGVLFHLLPLDAKAFWELSGRSG